MNNILRIKRKMEKVYKRPIDNIYSHSFYSELFSGYEYSLSEEKINRRDFYIIIPDDKEIVELTSNVDYVGAWTKFQSGELTVSELNNIVWKGLTD